MARIVKKFEDRKADIVNAARHLFQTQEYDKTTMQDIMDALGIAKGTIYHYFKSKEELLEAVIEDIVEKTVQKMRGIIQDTKGNALEKIQILSKAGNMTKDNEAIIDHLHKPGLDAMHSRLLAATLVKLAPVYAEVIKQGCSEGLFKTEAPLECAEFILSAIQFLTDMGIYPWTPEDLHRRIQAFPKLIERQLEAPPGSFQFLIDQMEIK